MISFALLLISCTKTTPVSETKVLSESACIEMKLGLVEQGAYECELQGRYESVSWQDYEWCYEVALKSVQNLDKCFLECGIDLCDERNVPLTQEENRCIDECSERIV